MRLNGAVFFYDYHDSQAGEFAPPLNPFVVNANARTQGAELEAQLIPLPGLTLSASGSYLDNTVDDIHARR
jgi:outer membrane receptor protein involved in Fe transport